MCSNTISGKWQKKSELAIIGNLHKIRGISTKTKKIIKGEKWDPSGQLTFYFRFVHIASKIIIRYFLRTKKIVSQAFKKLRQK